MTNYYMSVLPTGIYSPAARTAQTPMFACICSLTKPGDTARGHMSRRRQSILSSMTSTLGFFWDCQYSVYSVTEYKGASVTFFFPPTLFYHRFEFQVTLEEAQTRKLDVAVKNNKMFHTRERKDIGMVGITTCDRPCFLLLFLFLTELTTWLQWLAHICTQ